MPDTEKIIPKADEVDSIINEFTEKKADNSAEITEDTAEQNDTDETYASEETEEYEEEVKPVSEKPEKKRRKKKKSYGRLIFGLSLTTVILVTAFACAYFIIRYGKEIVGLDKPSTQIVVEITENSTTDDIANMLADEGVISDAWLFKAISRIRGADGLYIAGEHIVAPNMGYDELIETLQDNSVNQREEVEVTFVEGVTLLEAAKLLESEGVCDADDFIDTFNSSSFGFDFEKQVGHSNMKFYRMEGYFFPDTYRFYKEEDPQIVAKRIYANFENKVTPDYYGRMKDLGMTLDETITLASIIQAEAGNMTEMKKVSSVFRNRLSNADRYPLLQSDPTTKYVEKVIKPNIEVPYEAMFEAYDTYTGAGLPPGPICNPGLDAIYAALYPAQTDYLFFCANVETREIYYATTNAEHEENLKLAGLK